MSYDLYFRSRTPEASISRDDFKSYFGSRPYWKVEQGEAWYSREDTGVYFSFHFASAADSDEAESRHPLATPVAFNINYFRPHTFGPEAEPEVAAFVQHFDLTVNDPQLSGMGEGEYSAEGFLRGSSNRSAAT